MVRVKQRRPRTTDDGEATTGRRRQTTSVGFGPGVTAFMVRGPSSVVACNARATTDHGRQTTKVGLGPGARGKA